MNAPVIQFVDGPVGQIETASLLCDLAQPMPAQALLLLHPHPLHGGTMGNKVVTTIARVARDGGLPAVAFNFRSAGRSTGVWDHGQGELLDALAVASRMIDQGVQTFCLAGFSFGGSIAAYLIPQLKTAYPTLKLLDLVQVAPAVDHFPINTDLLHDVPRAVIFNADDDVVSPEAIAAYAHRVGATVFRSESGGHFFHGELTRLKSTVALYYESRGVL
jgi:alpha/beta superfamily hydrolase